MTSASSSKGEDVPLKAFAVTEENENTGGIVFAKHAIAARRIGANEYADGEFGYVTCRRAKWADEYADKGDVPLSAMVEAGWNFECGSCGRRIDSDMCCERDIALDDIIGSQRSIAYCNAVCEAEYKLHRAKAERVQLRWIRRFRRLVKARFPDAVVITGEGIRRENGAHAYATTDKDGRWHIDQVAVSFEFPGMQIAPATLRYDRRASWGRNGTRPDKPYWSCCNGDRDVFEAWAKQPRAAHLTDQEGQNR